MQIISKKNPGLASLFIVAFLMSVNVFAADRYWVGTGANTSWNNTANWSTTSGGASGSSVPGSSDDAYFDGNGTGQCSVDATVNIRKLSMGSGYTDTIKQNTYTITVGTSGMVLSGGTFLGGSAAITDNGVFTLSGCTFISTTSSLTIVGNYTFSSGTFTHNNGEVIFTTTSTLTGNTTFYNLTFSPASNSTYTIGSSTTLTCNGVLAMTGTVYITINTGTINAQGDITISNTYPSYYGAGGSGTINICGTGAQVFTGGTINQGRLCNIKIDKSSGTLTLKNTITITGNWNYVQGAIDATTYTSTIVLATGTHVISGSHSLYNLTIDTQDGNCVNTVSSGDTLTVLGELKTTGSDKILIYTGTISAKGDITISNTYSSHGGGGSGTINICGTGTQVFTGGTINQGRLCNIKINKSSGTLTLKNTISLEESWTYTQGTIDASTYNSTVVFATGTRTISGSHSLYNVTIDAEAGNSSNTISSGDTLTVLGELKITQTSKGLIYTGTINAKGDITITNTNTLSGGTGYINICGTGSQILTGSGVVGQGELCNVKINKPSGTLTLKNIISVYGNWTYVQGTIDATTYSSTVAFTDNTRTISGSHSLNIVSIDAGTTTISTNDTLTVLGELKIIGSGNNVIINTGTINAKGDITITNNHTASAGSGSINICGTSSQILTGSGTINQGKLCNIKINKPSGTLTLKSIISVYGNWTYVQGTIDATTYSSTVAFTNNTKTISGSHSLNIVSIDAETTTIPTNDTLTVLGELKIIGSSNAVIINTGTINAKGDITITNVHNGSAGSGSINICGTSNQIITGGTINQGKLCNVKINKPSGTLTLKNTISVYGNWTYIQGAIDATTYSSTVAFSASTKTISGSHSLNNVSIDAGTTTISTNDTLTVLGELKAVGSSIILINTGTINAKGDITVTNVHNSNGGTASINICGTGNQTYTGVGVANLGKLCDIKINKPSGTLTLSSIISVGNLNGWTYVQGTVDPGTSTVCFYGSTQNISAFTFNNLTCGGSSSTKTATGALTVNGVLTINSGFTLDMVTNTLSGNMTSTSGTGTFKTQNTSSTPIPAGVTWTPTFQYNSSSAQTIVSGNYAALNGTGGDRTLSSTGTVGISGTFTVGSGTYTTTGSTIDFNGAAQNIPAFTFNNLTCSGTGDKTASAALTVNGALTIDSARTLNMVTYALSGSTITSSGTGILKTQNTTSTPIPTGKTWAPALQFNSASAQTIVDGNYSSIDATGGNRTLSSTGTIAVSGTFTKGSGTYTITGSTFEFSGDEAQTIPLFTFNNLATNGAGTKSVSGNFTVNGTLTLTDGELALGDDTLTLASNTYNAITQTKGYISTTGNGTISRPTASINAYVFPMGYRTLNDSADYFSFSLTPGLSSAQNFTSSLNSNNAGFVITHDQTLYGSASSTVAVSITSSSYNAVALQYDIDNSADISAVRVFDQNDNTLKTLPADFYTITDGNQLTILSVAQVNLAFSKAINNEELNWTYEISYDGNGIPVSEQIQYLDFLGRPTQTQVRNMADNTVLATQTVYDNYGRGAVQSLPAPIGSVMKYQYAFMTTAGTDYNYTNFDVTAKLNSPDAIDNIAPGTLGWYYSDNNNLEAYQATTSYPYSRVEFTGAGRQAAAGDEYRMGAGHESKGYSMVSGTELKFIFGTDKSYKDSVTTADKLVNNSLTITGGIQASKTISVDADGKEVISYDVGGMPVAACYTGITGACTMENVINTMVYAGTSSVDIHLPSANKSSMELPLPTYWNGSSNVEVSSSDITYKITDVATNAVLALTTDYTVHATTRVVTFNGSYATGSSVFRISFVYSPSLITSLTASGYTIPDVQVYYDLDYSRWSVNYYDLAGRLRKSVSPKGINCSSPGTINFATTYDYSSKGQLIASNSADEGKKEMTYDEEGKPRFSQDAVQAAADKFSYSNYDAHGRVMESGEYASSNNGSSSVFFQNYYGDYSAPYTNNTPTASIINNTDNTGMLAGDCSNKHNIYYYPLASAEDISGSYTYKSSYSPRYTMGAVCKTKNDNSATWYGYNQAGQTVFTVQQMLDADYTGYQSGIDNQIKTVDYTYATANGTLSDQTYQKNVTAEKLKHIFTYDAALRLKQVDVLIEAETTAVTQEKYMYYTTGALKRKEVGDKLQGIDYIYTVNGQLKSINNPSLDETTDPGQDGKTGSTNAAFGKDVFGLALDYHTDDYKRTSSNVISISNGASNIYNGMIREQRYKTRAITNSVDNHANNIYGDGLDSTLLTGTTDEIMHRYAYDDEYRLITSIFGKFTNNNNNFTAISSYKEWGASAAGGIEYDANGNITGLKRNAYIGSGGLAMDNLTYNYTSNTNQLESITDAVSAGAYNTDFDASSAAYSYDENGRMTSGAAEGGTDITYYNTGLTKKVTFGNNNTAEYWYDDRGQKIKTKYHDDTSGDNKYTWYVNDASGNTLAIYEYDEAAGTPAFTLIEEPIYGSGRIGTIDKVSDIIDYEITDHLGNVRATIKGISTGVYELTSRTDYYAFGGAMPGRSYQLNSYRYNYQGQENAVNDNGTNWQAFELRMHSPDLGRWMSPDPYGQFHSPYISMGNNPVSGVDPDGGYVNGGAWANLGPSVHIVRNTRTGETRTFTGDSKLGLDEVDITNDLIEAQQRQVLGAFYDGNDEVMGSMGESFFHAGYGEGGDTDAYGNSIGWEKHFNSTEWGANLLMAYWDGINGGLDRDEAKEAASEVNRHGWGAAMDFIDDKKEEKKKKELERLKQEMEMAIEMARQQSAQQPPPYIHDVKTPPRSPGDMEFGVMYSVGQNDVRISFDFLSYKDKLTIWYDDGESPGFKLLYSSKGEGLEDKKSFDFSQNIPSLAGATIYIGIKSSNTHLTSKWEYKFQNTGGSLLSASHFFTPWYGRNQVDWIRKNPNW